jgi:hypothetical protein
MTLSLMLCLHRRLFFRFQCLSIDLSMRVELIDPSKCLSDAPGTRMGIRVGRESSVMDRVYDL